MDQIPPTTGRCSKTATLNPAEVQRWAVSIPNSPAPITTTSTADGTLDLGITKLRLSKLVWAIASRRTSLSGNFNILNVRNSRVASSLNVHLGVYIIGSLEHPELLCPTSSAMEMTSPAMLKQCMVTGRRETGASCSWVCTACASCLDPSPSITKANLKLRQRKIIGIPWHSPMNIRRICIAIYFESLDIFMLYNVIIYNIIYIYILYIIYNVICPLITGVVGSNEQRNLTLKTHQYSPSRLGLLDGWHCNPISNICLFDPSSHDCQNYIIVESWWLKNWKWRKFTQISNITNSLGFFGVHW